MKTTISFPPDFFVKEESFEDDSSQSCLSSPVPSDIDEFFDNLDDFIKEPVQKHPAVVFNMRFVFTSLLMATSVSFLMGYSSSSLIHPQQSVISNVPNKTTTSRVYPEKDRSKTGALPHMPVPVLHPNKTLPRSKYTHKLNSVPAVRSSHTVHVQVKDRHETYHDVPQNPEGETYEPSGQHLLIDIKNVNGEFLNSEERLAQAILDVVKLSSLTLLSYECHAFSPNGVSCVGVLMESHISLHTWPEDGVILFDLYTCGSASLLPLLPEIERLFGVPEDLEGYEAPKMLWSHKLRGFRERKNILEPDLERYVLGPTLLEDKQQITSLQTNRHRIDIYDIINPHPNTKTKHDRLLFLDGILQKSRSVYEPYHEALVHPGMFAHPHPRRIALSAGDGGVLHEVLKHNTVERVTALEPDEAMMRVSRDFLQLGDCSDLTCMKGSSCFDDARVEFVNENKDDWFLFLTNENNTLGKEPYDVVIFDDSNKIQNDLSRVKMIFASVYAALAKNGILIIQLGSLETDFKFVYDLGFESVHVYEEAHGNFQHPMSFLVACKDSSCRKNWYMDDARLETTIHERSTHSCSDSISPLFQYFDVATMNGYRHPPKAWKNTCKNGEIV